MNKESDIWRLNLIKLVNQFDVAEDAHIKSRNHIIGLYRNNNPQKDKCNFYIGARSLVTVRHSFDCTDEIVIGDNVVFAGKDTQVWTHGFDINRNIYTGRVAIGNNIYIGSRCTICQKVSICDQIVVGAATCVSRSISEPGFYVSNQLIRKSEIMDYSLPDDNLCL